MRCAGLILSCLLTVPAGAGIYVDADGKSWNIIDPPQYYQKAPYGGQISVHLMPEERVRSYCFQTAGKNDPHGCSLPMPHYCLIAISDRLPPQFREAVRVHEEAHCRGWPADHPVEPPLPAISDVTRYLVSDYLEQPAILEEEPAVRAEFDYCPELNRSPANPEGDRDCGPGCIPEDSFSFESAVATIERWADDFWNRHAAADAWEYDIGTHEAMVVSLGAILRLRMLLAQQVFLASDGELASTANAAEYERRRMQYCEFLKTANYLD